MKKGYKIHKFLEKKGIKHQRKEWYVFDKGETFVDYTNEAIAVVNEIISNSSQDTRVEYIPRYFQTIIKNQTYFIL